MATLIESNTIETPSVERLLEAVQNTLKKIASMNEGIELCRQVLEPNEDENEDITIWSYKKMKHQMVNDLAELLRKMDVYFKVEDALQAA